MGMKGYGVSSQVTQSFQLSVLQARDSSRMANCGSSARGWPASFAARWKFARHAFERVEIDAVGANFFHQFGERLPGRRALIARARDPRLAWGKTLSRRDGGSRRPCCGRRGCRRACRAADRIDCDRRRRDLGRRARLGRRRSGRCGFRYRRETVHGVFALFGIVEGAIPDKQLHLREDALRPRELGARVFGIVEAQALKRSSRHAFRPASHAVAPPGSSGPARRTSCGPATEGRFITPVGGTSACRGFHSSGKPRRKSAPRRILGRVAAACERRRIIRSPVIRQMFMCASIDCDARREECKTGAARCQTEETRRKNDYG